MDSPPLDVQNGIGGKKPIVYLRRINHEIINVSEDSGFSSISNASVNSIAATITINDKDKPDIVTINNTDEPEIITINDKDKPDIVTINNTDEPEIITINDKNEADIVAKNYENETAIDEDIKFVDAEFKTEELNTDQKKKNINSELLRKKHLDREAHEMEFQEKQYKRLMHLLKQSKAFSNFISTRFKEASTNDKEKKKRKKNLQNYDSPSKKKEKLNNNILSKKTETYTNNIKISLSNEKIEEELASMSDEETVNKENIDLQDDFIQPKYFQGELRDYQKEGLNWLKLLYENGLNGILADEMGLGKTIQLIAFFAYLIEKRISGPYLIIVPLSTLPNWVSEFERFAPRIPVVVCYRNLETTLSLKQKISKKVQISSTCSTHPVVLTTFHGAMNNVPLLRLFHWKYIVIDEAQRIKNSSCLLFKVVKGYESVNRLLLTGTPLQNNLSELWSLLNFLLPDIFNNLEVFESWFDAKQVQDEKGKKKFFKQEEEKQVMSALREILHPFMLRRLKEDVCPDIPLFKEIIIYTPLTKLQYDLYSAVLNKSLNRHYCNEIESNIIDIDGVRPKRQCTKKVYSKNFTFEQKNINENRTEKVKYTNNDLKEIEVWSKFIQVSDENINFLKKLKLSNFLIIYRHIVNHPYIIYNPIIHMGVVKSNDDILKASGKMLVLDMMLKKLKNNNHKVLLFSTMSMVLDIIEEYLYTTDYLYVRLDGSIDYKNRKNNIERFNTDSEVFLFLLTTKAGGVGLNLTAADTVIIFDSDWNPQNDLQAMARCHRIGQTKPVAVYRLCTKGTVDEEIIKRSNAKRLLEKAVISKEESLVNTKEGLLKLKKLLDGNAFEMLNSQRKAHTEAELNELLDRSNW